MKHLVYRWARIIKNAEEHVSDEEKYLSKYDIVIPIILRLVTSESSIAEIIQAHMCPPVSQNLITALVDFIKNEPKSVLFILDGYDELIQTKFVDSILRCWEHTDVTCITTTRPHGVSQIKTLISLQQLAKLCGFNDHQIQQYITQFFKEDRKAEEANELIDYLFNKRIDLLQLAHIPIRLEMMCFVWSKNKSKGTNKDLGEKVVDLYKKFVIHLIDHLEKKNKILPRAPEQEVQQRYDKTLYAVAKLAYSWECPGKLQTVFTDSDLQKDEPLRQDILNLGCITKYHPVSIKENSEWIFTHLTLQEYFVAYYLTHYASDEELQKYAEYINNTGQLRQQEVILKFVVGLKPEKGNQILKKAVSNIIDGRECKEILKSLGLIITEYKLIRDINLNLPNYVELKPDETCTTDIPDTYKTLEALSLSQRKDDHGGIVHLVITGYEKWKVEVNDFMSNFLKSMAVDTVLIFEVTISKFKSLTLIKSVVERMMNIQQLKIAMKIKGTSKKDQEHMKNLLKSIESESLERINVTGKGAFLPVANFSNKCKNIKEISVKDTKTVPDSILSDFTKSVNKYSHPIKINVCLNKWSLAFLSMGKDHSLSLEVKDSETNDEEESVTDYSGDSQADADETNITLQYENVISFDEHVNLDNVHLEHVTGTSAYKMEQPVDGYVRAVMKPSEKIAIPEQAYNIEPCNENFHSINEQFCENDINVSPTEGSAIQDEPIVKCVDFDTFVNKMQTFSDSLPRFRRLSLETKNGHTLALFLEQMTSLEVLDVGIMLHSTLTDMATDLQKCENQLNLKELHITGKVRIPGHLFHSMPCLETFSYSEELHRADMKTLLKVCSLKNIKLYPSKYSQNH